MRNKRRCLVSGAGFTMVELITIIIVIVILAAVALPQYTAGMERGSVSKARARVDAMRKSEVVYYGIYGAYTSNLNLLTEVPEAIAGLTGGSDGDWTYAIGTSGDSYTITATRKAGIRSTYASKTMEIDVDGQCVGGSHPLRR